MFHALIMKCTIVSLWELKHYTMYFAELSEKNDAA